MAKAYEAACAVSSTIPPLIAVSSRRSLDLSPDAARRLNPFLETKGVAAVMRIGDDMYLNPVQLAVGFARAARRTVRWYCRKSLSRGFLVYDLSNAHRTCFGLPDAHRKLFLHGGKAHLI